VRSPRFEPGSSAWQADVLDQTRLRPHSAGLRHSKQGKVVSLLLNLKKQGKNRMLAHVDSKRKLEVCPSSYITTENQSAISLPRRSVFKSSITIVFLFILNLVACMLVIKQSITTPLYVFSHSLKLGKPSRY
jgi:hypothetical protein